MTTTHKIERKINISEIEELYYKLSEIEELYEKLNNPKFHTDMWYDYEIEGGDRTYDFFFISNNEKSEKERFFLTFETNNDGLISSVTYDGNSNFFINDKFIDLLCMSDFEGLDHQMWKDLHRWLGLGDYHFDFEMGHKLDTSTVLKRTPIKL